MFIFSSIDGCHLVDAYEFHTLLDRRVIFLILYNELALSVFPPNQN